MSPISPSKDGGSPIVMRKPVLNGNTDTIQKLGTGCFASNIVLDPSPKKNLGVSKFSQAVSPFLFLLIILYEKLQIFNYI